MAPSVPSDPSTGQRGPLSEAEVVMRMLGTDPWMRFDLWANRAWEVAEKANELALHSAPPISSDDAVFDPRVFAEMVNPLVAISGAGFGYDVEPVEEPSVIFTMVAEAEETESD
jgi:hypothetical protein